MIGRRSHRRPFDQDRDGIVCGEGQWCFSCLKNKQKAEARGARILGEIIGFATTSDTSSIANPDVGAMYQCMQQAVADAGIEATDLDYINAHATGTRQGDVAEAEAITRLVGDQVPVSSLKGHLGHTMAASGAIELAATLAMMQAGEVVGTRNLEQVDDACGGITILNSNKKFKPRLVLKNNFAMGGINCSLIIRSCDND